MKKKWIPKNMKRGALRRQLKIPRKKKIPVTLLRKIRETKIGKRIRNPTKIGKRLIRVTRLLKHRSVLALTMRHFPKRKARRRQ